METGECSSNVHSVICSRSTSTTRLQRLELLQIKALYKYLLLLLFTTSEERTIRDFLEILKRSLRNFEKMFSQYYTHNDTFI